MKTKPSTGTPPEAVISVIGAGMKIVGDCETDGAVRVDGMIEGNIRASKAVVVGKEGLVQGNLFTQDAVVSGRVDGSVVAESRLEVQSTAVVTGDIRARRMQLEEGAALQGQVLVGERASQSDPSSAGGSSLSNSSPEEGLV